MPKVEIIVREPGRKAPDYSLLFELPQVPQVGDYISIQRPDKPEPYGEDMIVKQVWWRLKHPETRTVTSSQPKTGMVGDIFVECAPAVGPYSSDDWRHIVEGSSMTRGAPVEVFDIERFSVPEGVLKGSADER